MCLLCAEQRVINKTRLGPCLHGTSILVRRRWDIKQVNIFKRAVVDKKMKGGAAVENALGCGLSLDQMLGESLSQERHFPWGLKDKEYPAGRHGGAKLSKERSWRNKQGGIRVCEEKPEDLCRWPIVRERETVCGWGQEMRGQEQPRTIFLGSLLCTSTR